MEKSKVQTYVVNNTEKENLVKVITEYRESNIIVGGEIYMSSEDAKSILALSNATEDNDAMQQSLWLCRDILRAMAKQVLYQPSNFDIGLQDIAQKYK